ncbi:hypothetical protein DXK94_07560 [Arthrobacter sp. RT-1]|uniref:hypothetical protein n=1 Tax=Arthrobacter sp. RT-1 TaxID=2292263 RepID=UPI000E1EA09D|nr:hypothetical protein [Arthrobacter sp. RT-1]RDV11009.1 hypothetical protein DXK94_07560 [Arthrobacter sp. RT-1]
MSLSYDHESLWLKAKLFLNRAMDDDGSRSFDEQALWASLALELLAKAALCKVSPVLIAEPTEDGKNVLAAAGLGGADPVFTSVRATTIFVRCKRAFPPFNADKAKKIALSRNEYLHGGGIGFGVIPADNWWADFWSVASILVDAQDKTIAELVGATREGQAASYLARNKTYMADRLESLISRAQQRFAQKEQGNLPPREQKQWRSAAALIAEMDYSVNEACPACGNEGTLEGDYISETRLEGYDDPHMSESDSWGVADINSEYFSCESCQLILDTYELIELSELPDEFTVPMDPELVAEHEGQYGND